MVVRSLARGRGAVGLVFGIALVLVVTGTPLQAATPQSSTAPYADSLLAHVARPGITLSAEARDAANRLDVARVAALHGSLADAVAAAAALARVPVEHLHSAHAAPPPLPAGLAAPVATLLDGIATATDGARGAVALSDAEVTALQDDALSLLDETLVARPTQHTTQNLLRRADALEARITAGVDRTALYSSAFALSQAIDAALPALRDAAGPPVAAQVEGCDIVDQAPALCIGNTAANTIRKHYALVVDLGGDDIHLNSAGGAAPTLPENGLPVAVTIDVGGNDRYETSPAQQAEAVQGTGRTGGIGFLVDVAGDDSYSAVARRGATPDLINAQGAAVAGVGVLADLGGADRYSIHNAMGGDSNSGAQGLGTGAIGGIALAIDRGAGDDTSLVAATPNAHERDGAAVSSMGRAGGFGNAAGAAVAVFADDGGRDNLTVRSAPEPVAPGAAANATTENSVVQAFGYGGLGGASLAVTGSRSQNLNAEGLVDSPASAGVTTGSFGWSALGGVAAVVDLAGDDTHTIDMRSLGQGHTTATDTCDCAGTQHVVQSGAALAAGMGSVVFGGVFGLMADLGGDDDFNVSAVSQATFQVDDARAADQRDVGLRMLAAGGRASANVQGFSATGSGILIDVAGADAYTTHVRSDATISGSAAATGNTLTAAPGEAVVEAQGAAWGELTGVVPAIGVLLDGGGADRYSSWAGLVATRDNVSDTQPGIGLTQGAVRQNGVGVLVDADNGAADVFTSFPAVEACEGTRGQDVWRDCGSTMGLGVNK